MARARKPNRSNTQSVRSQASRRSNQVRTRNSARTSEVRLLDDNSRRDIAGVSCAVIGIVLFVAAVIPENGLVTEWLSDVLHIGLGLGAFLLPIVLLLIAISLFASRIGEKISVRVALGLIIFFFALLSLLAVFTPGADSGDLTGLFTHDHLVAQGGYVGALIAWVLLTLLGQLASAVVLAGALIISLIVIGISITGSVAKLRERIQLHRAQKAELSESLQAEPAGPYQARTKKVRRPAIETNKGGNSVNQPDASGDVTKVLGGLFDTKESGHNTAGLKDIFNARKRDENPSQSHDAQTHKLTSRDQRDTRAHTTPSRAQVISTSEPSTRSFTRSLGRQKQPASSPKTRKASSSITTPHPSEGFLLPDPNLLKRKEADHHEGEDDATLRETAQLLQDTLFDFGVEASVEGWAAGPTVTLYKVALPSGVRVSRVNGLTDDIALAMASQGVRIFSPVPGTNYVGIEVPNVKRRTVLLGDVLDSAPVGPLQVAIGEDVEGHPIVNDLAKMPHLLVAGTTGSGKSVAINGMIMSILMRATPAEVRFIMIDPKRVEFTPYNGIPHLYVPVVTECKEAASALAWAVAEMERRLKLFSKVGAKNIAEFNGKAQAGMMIGDAPADEVPYIVIVIDELADLMMNVGKEVEMSISRLAQLARAAGIHMIIATQRPSTNVVTGLIKANITNRMALTVASGIDSRVILDATGAENLIGNGDMLYGKPEYPKPQRLQGCYTSNKEIEEVVAHLKEQGEPEYHQEILQVNVISIGNTMPDGSSGTSSSDDPLIWEAAEIVVNAGFGSTSNIQRRLKVGYSRAGRIMDMLEEKGIVGPPNGSKPRDVLVDTMELETLKAFEQNDEVSGE